MFNLWKKNIGARNNMEQLHIFSGKNVLITGGLGFIGSNLAHELTKLKARITIADSLSKLYGGNIFIVNKSLLAFAH